MAAEEEESNNEDEQRFLRMFSKQLADVLRAKDEEEAEEKERLRGAGGASRQALGDSRDIDETKEWERLRSTYKELCHDDPIILGGNGDCRRLAKALIPKQQKKSTKLIVKKDKLNAKNNANKLALSCRLVDGIIQATARAGEKSFTSASSNNITTQTNDINNNADTTSEQEQSMFSPTITTSEGYAEIAFAVFVEGPYKCIQKADNLQIASKFLGSFQPPDTSNARNNEQLSAEEKSRLVDEATAKIVSGLDKMSMEGTDNETNTKSADNNVQDDASSSSSEFHTSKQIIDADNDSMAEVFAEESDPDDYDFGPSSYDAYSSTSDVQAIFGGQKQDANTDLSFNPLTLSEPNTTNQTWEGARKAIHHLLSCASYGKLALGSISSRAWSQGDMSETLADFAFMLLLENDGKVDASSTQDSLLCTQESSEEDIVALWDRPLFLLRDRAMDKNHGHDALPAYLQLLTAFLSHSDEHDVMSILSSPLGNASHSGNNNTLSPATTVGLSSLASVCSSKEMLCSSSSKMAGTSVWSVCPREEVKKAILSSLYSLAHIVECVRPSKAALGKSISTSSTPDNNKSPWIRTAVCIISIIEYMTNLQARFDFQPLYEGGGNSQSGTTLSESDAKELSDSGLFREMLSLYTITRPEKNLEGSPSGGKQSNAEDVVRSQLLRTIFTLSAQSPELLGRYAVRVPDFANEVHSSTFMENNLVDGILWTSIGSSLLENKDATSSKPRLKLRANSKLNAKTPQIETKTLAERSILWFVALCMSSKKALEDMKQLVLIAESNDLSDDQKKEYDACKDTLGKLKEFSNCLANCPSATTMWLDSLKNKEDAISIARASIEELKSTLATLPSFSDKEMAILHQGHKKDDDDKGTESPKEDGLVLGNKSGQRILKEYGAVVASIRSSVKVIALGLDSQKGSGLSVKGSSMPSFNPSSKTD